MNAIDNQADYPSLSLIYDEINRQLAQQSEHVDSLDTKASIFLGFIAVMLASIVFARIRFDLWTITGLAFSFLSFLFALATYQTRKFYFGANPRHLRENYPNQALPDAQFALIDNAVVSFEENLTTIQRKVLFLRLTSVTLFIAVLIFALRYVI